MTQNINETDTSTDESTSSQSLYPVWEFERGDTLIRDERNQRALLKNEFVSPDTYIVMKRLIDPGEGVAYYQLKDLTSDNVFLRNADDTHSLYQEKPDPPTTGPQAA